MAKSKILCFLFTDLYQRSDLEPLNKTCNETSFCKISLQEVYGFPSPAFVWEFRKNYSEDFREIGSNSDWSSRFAVSSDGMLCNRNVSNFDEGEYRCKIGNSSRTLFSNVYRVKVTS